MFKKILSIILTAFLILGICGCNSREFKEDFKYITTGYSVNAEGDYDGAVAGWEKNNAEIIKKDFDNLAKDGVAATPGNKESLKNVDMVRPMSKKSDESSVEKSEFEPSALCDSENVKYVFKGKNYAYGITNDKKEYIAFIDENGDMFDVFNGAGKISVKSDQKISLLYNSTLKDFRAEEKDGATVVTTHYELIETGVSDVTYEVVYTLKENAISVEARVKLNSKYTIADTGISRGFVNGQKGGSVRVNTVWCYPENGGQPYQEFESLALKAQITDTVYSYTFVRSEGLRQYWNVEGMSAGWIPATIEKGEKLDYTFKYDMSFVDTATERYQGADYLGLFKSYGSDFAAGVGMVTDSGDDSTVFESDSATLNINVTNLTDKALKYSLKYDIIDSYGTVVDEGVFVDEKIGKAKDANRTVEVKGKYGMYYLNLYVVSEKGSWREHYPLALLEEYDYKYQKTSPWGINSTNCNKNNDNEWIGSAHLMEKVGSLNYRLNSEEKQLFLADELIKLGVTRFIGAMNVKVANENNIEAWTNGVMNIVEKLSKYAEYIEVGNEFNLQCLRKDGPSEEEAYPQWHKYMYEPSYKAMTEKYPDIIYLPTPDSACSPNWLNQFVNGYLDENGKRVGAVWNDVKAVSTHIYGPPYMPDTYSLYEPKYGEGLWHIEPGMQRMKANLERLNNGDVTKQDFLITEIGYRAMPTSKTEVDYQTQANYNARIGIICPAYSADVLGYYCMYDRTSIYAGEQPGHMEWYFGMFHEHDYYGIVKAKPSGVAFGVMTRQLESYKKDTAYIDDEYDEGWDFGGVRAFTYDTDLHGKVVCAWSNYEVLPNGKCKADGSVDERKQCLPWESLWEKEDPTVFKAAGDTVKVVDYMGNATEYKANDKGEVTVPLTGEPVYIFGVK